MDFYVPLTSDVYVVGKARKQMFGKHPIVSAELYYKNSKMRTYGEKTWEGVIYDNLDDHSIVNLAMLLLHECFSYYGFTYDDFPFRLEYGYDENYKKKVILPYEYSRFPIGSIFEVESLLIDKTAQIYYVLNNSVEGRVIAPESIMVLFPEIMSKYERRVRDKETVLGFLSQRVFKKRFRVLKYGTYYEGKSVEEII